MNYYIWNLSKLMIFEGKKNYQLHCIQGIHLLKSLKRFLGLPLFIENEINWQFKSALVPSAKPPQICCQKCRRRSVEWTVKLIFNSEPLKGSFFQRVLWVWASVPRTLLFCRASFSCALIPPGQKRAKQDQTDRWSELMAINYNFNESGSM